MFTSTSAFCYVWNITQIICRLTVDTDDTTLHSECDLGFYFFHLIFQLTLMLLMWKSIGPSLIKNSFKILILSFFYKLNWVFAFPLLLKLPLKNWRLHFFTIDLPSGLAWNSVNMSILVLLIAPWIFWKSYRNIDVGCWS